MGILFQPFSVADKIVLEKFLFIKFAYTLKTFIYKINVGRCFLKVLYNHIVKQGFETLSIIKQLLVQKVKLSC